MTPLINHPEVAILGLHRIAPRPVVRDGEIVVRRIGNVSVTFDHRVVDGVQAAQFCLDLIGRLQEPGWEAGRMTSVPARAPGRALHFPLMGAWYAIGITVGLGLGAGILCAGLLAGLRFGIALTVAAALAVGIVSGLVVKGWVGAGGGSAGAVIGAVSAAVIVRGAGRRGATLGGTAFLLACAAIVVAVLALIPAVGYVEAVVVPALAARRSRGGPQKYAGLRSLAK